MEQLNKLSKQALISQIENTKTENEQLKLALTNTINVANYFGANLEKIEGVILKTALKDGVKNSFLWVVRNWKELVEIVKVVIETIKEVRRRIDELKAQQEQAKQQNEAAA